MYYSLIKYEGWKIMANEIVQIGALNSFKERERESCLNVHSHLVL
jgi:hypothetical protein